MVRSASRTSAVAVLGVAGCAIYGQLPGSTFMCFRSAFGAPFSSVPVAAAQEAAPTSVKASPAAAAAVAGGTSKAQIAEAQKQAKLLAWAYETAVAKGMPQAAMMKTKADQAVAALEAMKVGSKQTAMR
mmetsp:Transcript_7132/g.17883  ORF Transcript_7132/g.17883 Transcript_7132/m.17883 type:complete len:129 (-) Transcript_7132:329-715(-)